MDILNVILLMLVYPMRLTSGLLGAIISGFLALMNLTDVLMTLLILTTRYRGDLDSILIEDITFLSYDLEY